MHLYRENVVRKQYCKKEPIENDWVLRDDEKEKLKLAREKRNTYTVTWLSYSKMISRSKIFISKTSLIENIVNSIAFHKVKHRSGDIITNQ